MRPQPGTDTPLAVWPFTLLDWPMGMGPEIFPYSSRTFVFFFVYLMFSGNLGRAFFPMLFYLLLEPNLMADPTYRKFCGDSDEAIGKSTDAGGPYEGGYRNHKVANDWVLLSYRERAVAGGERTSSSAQTGLGTSSKLLAAPAPSSGAPRLVGVNPRYGFRMASTRTPSAEPDAHAAHGNEDLLGGGGAAVPRSASLDASRLMLLSLVMLDAANSSSAAGRGGALLSARRPRDVRPLLGNLSSAQSPLHSPAWRSAGLPASNRTANESTYLRRAFGCRVT